MSSEVPMATLRRCAAALDVTLVALNAALDRRERDLQAVAPRLTHWVSQCLCRELVDPQRESTIDYWLLGYAHVEGEWRVAVRRCRSFFDTREDYGRYPLDPRLLYPARAVGRPIPLLDAPYLVRIEATDVIDLLVEELASEVSRIMAQLGKNHTKVASGLSSVP